MALAQLRELLGPDPRQAGAGPAQGADRLSPGQMALAQLRKLGLPQGPLRPLDKGAVLGWVGWAPAGAGVWARGRMGLPSHGALAQLRELIGTGPRVGTLPSHL